MAKGNRPGKGACIPFIFIFLIAGCFLAAHAAPICGWYFQPRTIQFDQNDVLLSTTAKQELDLLAEIMNANPDFPVVLEANAGNTKHGRHLSEARIRIVINYLVEHCKIDYQRFICRPHGNAFDNQVFCRKPLAGEEGPSCYEFK